MADKKISELLDTTSLTGEEPIPMVQNNSTVKASVNKIVNGLSEDLTLKTGTVQASADVDALFLKSDPGGASDGAMISLHSNDSNTSNQIYYKGNQHIFNTTSDTRLLTLNQNGASIGDEDPEDPDGNELLTRVEIESLVENQIQSTNVNIEFTYGVSPGNTFDVYPPLGYTMSDLLGFIPSIHAIHFSGEVDGNDSLYCRYELQQSSIKVTVYNTEQRLTPYANWLAVWGN